MEGEFVHGRARNFIRRDFNLIGLKSAVVGCGVLVALPIATHLAAKCLALCKNQVLDASAKISETNPKLAKCIQDGKRLPPEDFAQQVLKDIRRAYPLHRIFISWVSRNIVREVTVLSMVGLLSLLARKRGIPLAPLPTVYHYNAFHTASWMSFVNPTRFMSWMMSTRLFPQCLPLASFDDVCAITRSMTPVSFALWQAVLMGRISADNILTSVRHRVYGSACAAPEDPSPTMRVLFGKQRSQMLYDTVYHNPILMVLVQAARVALGAGAAYAGALYLPSLLRSVFGSRLDTRGAAYWGSVVSTFFLSTL